MTDFASHHVSQWRDGQTPTPKSAPLDRGKQIDLMTHTSDRFDALLKELENDVTVKALMTKPHPVYDVPDGESEAFLFWVAQTFSGDNDPVLGVDFTGTVRDYLDETSVYVREVFPEE